ncbi:MAG: hypothetical protein J6A68_02930 [Oscillospiraceae bacterium]|nr:hypothetical protein [Oscillospiraceae bacterium]
MFFIADSTRKKWKEKRALMMQQNTFVTEIDEQYAKKQTNKSFITATLILSLLASFGLLIGWKAFLLFEIVVLGSCFMAFLAAKNADNNNCELYFVGDRLFITNKKTHKRYEVYDIPASDFIINQKSKEKEMDYCSLMIKNTRFGFGGVKKYTELKQYISENYK